MKDIQFKLIKLLEEQKEHYKEYGFYCEDVGNKIKRIEREINEREQDNGMTVKKIKESVNFPVE